jgi:hypothetical protein
MTAQHALVPVRRTARQREERRIRIMGMVRLGFSYEAIARDECLSRERIRQIVAQSLDVEDGATRVDYVRLQMARLEPVLRLAARGVENGKLSAINALLRVLDKLDKYGAVTEPAHPYWEGAHERLIAKINAAAGRVLSPGVLERIRSNREARDAYRAQREASAAPKKLKTDLGWRKS